MKEFRCLTEATTLYRLAKKQKLKAFMRDQLLRASSSVALNLAEGNARRTQKDRLRFFNIALASLRETQMICRLEDLKELEKQANKLGGMIYVLNQNLTDTVTGAETVTGSQ